MAARELLTDDACPPTGRSQMAGAEERSRRKQQARRLLVPAHCLCWAVNQLNE